MEKKKKKKTSNALAILKRFRRSKLAVVGLTILLILVILAIIAPWIAPYTYDEMNLKEKLQGPVPSTSSVRMTREGMF